MSQTHVTQIDHLFPVVRPSWDSTLTYSTMYVLSTSVRKGKTRFLVTYYPAHSDLAVRLPDPTYLGHYATQDVALKDAANHYGNGLRAHTSGVEVWPDWPDERDA